MAITIFITFSCKKGDVGPKGDTGATGATGSKGDKGDPGSVNVAYSPWMLVDSSKWSYGPGDSTIVPDWIYFDTLIHYHVTLPASGIT